MSQTTTKLRMLTRCPGYCGSRWKRPRRSNAHTKSGHSARVDRFESRSITPDSGDKREKLSAIFAGGADA